MPLIVFFLLVISILFLIKICYIIGVITSISKTKGALFVHTPKIRIEFLLKNIDIKKGQLVVDLGCGDGRLICNIAKKKEVYAIGYEINFFPYILAKIRSFYYRKQVKIIWGDFFKQSLKNVDVILCYLFPDILKDVSIYLKNNFKEGALFVSFNFPLPGYIPFKIIYPPNTMHNEPIFIYELTYRREKI
jgi:SAM-dependent methyltransferase